MTDSPHLSSLERQLSPAPIAEGRRRSRKSHGRFFIALAVGLMLWLMSWVVLIMGQLGRAHPDNLWVKEAYALKLAAAERLIGQGKVLLVGGSATMFGADSLQVAEGLGRPAVNLGVNAGLGSYEVPRLVDYVLEPGDVAIMPLEYRLLLWDGVPSYVTLSWALEHPEALTRWRLKTVLRGLTSLPLDRVLQGYRKFDRTSLPQGPYGAHNLNARGDQMNTAASLRTDLQQQALQDLPPEHYDTLYDQSSLGLDEWEYWWQRWQLRGVCVVVVPPPFLFVSGYATPSYKKFFDGVPARVMERGVRYIGHPSDGFFPVEAMFDSNYHLTEESRADYTEWLIAALHSDDLNCLPEVPR
ncbi:MAG: hypothetical protein CML51_06045 [Rhodobacteraceae bacterium]|nr:hypothetical protein [Paracoccaceae bacterium]